MRSMTGKGEGVNGERAGPRILPVKLMRIKYTVIVISWTGKRARKRTKVKIRRGRDFLVEPFRTVRLWRAGGAG